MNNQIKLDLDTKLIKEFSSGFPFESYFAYISNFITCEDLIAVAGFLYPEFVKYEGHIFLTENYLSENKIINTPYGNDRKIVERFTNLFCISDFLFKHSVIELQDKYFETPNVYWQKKIADIIIYFWSRRLSELFPDIDFEFEIHENGLFYESGLCFTFSQK